jgi:hypothetical protein
LIILIESSKISIFKLIFSMIVGVYSSFFSPGPISLIMKKITLNMIAVTALVKKPTLVG